MDDGGPVLDQPGGQLREHELPVERDRLRTDRHLIEDSLHEVHGFRPVDEQVVTREDVTRVVAEWTGLSMERLAEGDRSDLVGLPYFTIPAAGWGGGWATSNVLRLNTVGALQIGRAHV